MLFLWLCKRSYFSFLQSTKIYVFYTNSLEFLDLFAKCLDHTSNLSILPLLEDDAELSWCDALYDTRTCHNVSKIDTLRQFVYFVIFDRSEYLYKIFFFMRKAWMHELMCNATIVCQEDKTRRLLIQSTNRKNTCGNINNIENAGLTTGHTGCDDTTRFIESIVNICELFFDDSIIELYSIDFRIDDLSNVSFDPINTDTTKRNEFFSMSTRCYSLLGEIFLKFHNEKDW